MDARAVFLKGLLSNIAAKYVETKASAQALVQLHVSTKEAEELSTMVEFVPELDRFDLKGTSVQLALTPQCWVLITPWSLIRCGKG